MTLKPSSTLSKRSLNEHLTIKHKKSIGVPYVGINASFFGEFEKKLDLLDGNAVKISKFIYSLGSFQYESHTYCTYVCNCICIIS